MFSKKQKEKKFARKDSFVLFVQHVWNTGKKQAEKLKKVKTL